MKVLKRNKIVTTVQLNFRQHKLYNKELYADFIAAQIKTLSFLAYIIRIYQVGCIFIAFLLLVQQISSYFMAGRWPVWLQRVRDWRGANVKTGLYLVVPSEVFSCECKVKTCLSLRPGHLWNGGCILFLQVDSLKRNKWISIECYFANVKQSFKIECHNNCIHVNFCYRN